MSEQAARHRGVLLSPNARIVLEQRYLRRDDQLRVVETPEQLFWRVARAVAEGDRPYDPNADVEALAEQFYDLMAGLEFLPNTPTLMNAGTELGQLMACFVLPVEDSLEGIFDTLKHAALIQKTAGGTGFAWSRLRPRGDLIRSTRGQSSGPISFMHLYDTMTDVIKQGSKRRGANMGVMRVDHPDIRDFITCKRDRTKFTNFNLSVGVTDAFMRAIARGKDYDLINPRTKRPTARVSAREIFDLIVENAWDSGEPGLLALDMINRHNPTPQIGEMEATNPCAEQPLLPYEACCLGSVNLSKMVRPVDGHPEIAWSRLGEVVRLATHFLENVVEVNRYPIPPIEQLCRRNRKIGLGVMGFADLLVALGVPYDGDEALGTADRVMGFVQQCGHDESARLAEQRGPFANFPGSIYDRPGGRPIRNATVTTVAPTGTISIIANCSSGIEPLFALAYVKRVLGGVELVSEPHPVFQQTARERGFHRDELMRRVAASGSIQHLEAIPADVRRLFVTAMDVDPAWHVRMQAAFQRHTDNGVSKTINLPEHARVEDVRKAYLLAYELGCKGITVYRYGSRPLQVLSVHGYCVGCAGEDGLPKQRPEGDPAPPR